MSVRRSLVIAGLVAAIAAVILFTMDDRPPRNELGVSESKRSEVTARPVAPPAQKTRGESASKEQIPPVPPPAPPSEPVAAERPQVKPLAQEDFIKRRESGLKLLDDTIARVERERDDAAKAKDVDRAAQARVRLQRLAAVRKQRADELEQARRGELQVNPDDQPAGPRPQTEPR